MSKEEKKKVEALDDKSMDNVSGGIRSPFFGYGVRVNVINGPGSIFNPERAKNTKKRKIWTIITICFTHKKTTLNVWSFWL